MGRVFLIFGLVFMGVWCVPTSSEAQVLDRIEIVTKDEAAEIQIVFNTRVLYKSHSPATEGDLLQVYLEFPQIPPTRRLRRQQVAASPRSEEVPNFSLLFPAQTSGRTRSLSVKFASRVQYTIRVKNQLRSSIVVISLPLDKPPPLKLEESPPEIAPPPPKKDLSQIPKFSPGESVQTQADELIRQAQAAMAEKQYEQATGLLNVLLNLPPNTHSELAQALVGVAREQNGEIEKARLEYELYLKLYPEGKGAARIRKHLAALGKERPKEKKLKKAKKKSPREIKEFSVYGALTEFYFGGLTQSKTTQEAADGTKTTIRDSTQDQSLLLTTADFTARFRFNQYDNKLVVRGSYGRDFEDTRDMNDPRLRALFLEHASKDSYLFRIGRQPGNAGGVLDLRFDGGWFRYHLAPQFAVNLVGGIPRPFILDPGRSADDPREFRLSTDRYLAGINFDFGPIREAWSGNTYFMDQTVHDKVDRRAVGTEVRYFDNGRNGFLLIDYDVHHEAFNIVNFNGTLVTEDRTTFNLLADYRKSPFLQTTNALLANGHRFSGSCLINAERRRIAGTSRCLISG